MPSGERSVRGLVLMTIVPDPQQTSSDSSQIFPQTEKRVSCSANIEDPDHKLVTKLLSSGLICLYHNFLHFFLRVDLFKYPGLHKIEHHFAFIEPGDCLYVPFLW